MIPGQVIIQPVIPQAICQETATSLLTPQEQERASEFLFDKDAAHWKSCRAQLRIALGSVINLPPQQVPLIFTEFGKPLLASPHGDLHFNISHSDELALIAISAHGPVGIDLEMKSRAVDLLGCEATFCHPQEIEILPNDPQLRASELLRIWTHKEALLKALGTGLSHPPEQVRIIFDQHDVSCAESDTPLTGITDQLVETLVHPMLYKYQAVLSAPTSTKSICFNGVQHWHHELASRVGIDFSQTR